MTQNYKYYDWQKTLSYNAPITMVITSRGRGKTFGLRKQAVNDYLKDGSRFVEVVRHANELALVANDYLGKITASGFFEGYIFKYTKAHIYIAKEPKDKKEKPQWELMGYFVALTSFQKTKKVTFTNVYRIYMDEAIIDTNDVYHRYLKNEWQVLSNIVDTCTRETPGEKRKHEPRLYLLGNACDLINPYFQMFDIFDEPKFGYTWYAGKLFLLHYEEPIYAERKAKETLAGKMESLTEEGDVALENKFINSNKDFIRSKTPFATYEFAIKFENKKYAIWIDEAEGLYFINNKIPNNSTKPVYALQSDDHTEHTAAIKRNSELLTFLKDLYYIDALRYDKISTREKFLTMLKKYGIN